MNAPEDRSGQTRSFGDVGSMSGFRLMTQQSVRARAQEVHRSFLTIPPPSLCQLPMEGYFFSRSPAPADSTQYFFSHSSRLNCGGVVTASMVQPEPLTTSPSASARSGRNS